MISAYNGNEPYVFVSYPHKDAHLVMPILQKMWENGFRIWYDKGIQGGFEWPEFIATKLFASSCVLAFISRGTIESKNCRREINFAIAKDKPLLAVYLEDCELPLGMQMQLDTLQALFCTTPDAIDSLIQKFQVTEVLQAARGKEEAAAVEQIRKDPIAEKRIPMTQRESVVQQQTTEESAVTEEPVSSQLEELVEKPEEAQEDKPWECTCGKSNPGNRPKCACGNWHCDCGRVNAFYVSSCCCGRSKKIGIGQQGETHIEKASPERINGWTCNCGKVNPQDKKKCDCGNWHCDCGRVLASYVSSCYCGKNKWGGVSKQPVKYAPTPRELPKKMETPQEKTNWTCTCGKTNPQDKKKCVCGNWRCSCGKILAAYVSTCSCGNSKWNANPTQQTCEVTATIEEKPEE